MHLEERFDVECERDTAAEIAGRDETLVTLFPDTRTRIVSRRGTRRTTQSDSEALGRSVSVRFHFDTLPDGDLSFEKVCDGNVWRELRGTVVFEGRGGRTRVKVSLDGRTRPFVPEFAIRGEMQKQIEAIGRALRERIERG